MFRDMAGIAQAARGRLEQNGDTEPRYQVGDRVVHLYTGKTTTVTRVVHKYNMYQLDGLPEDSVVGANDIRHHDV